MKSSVLLSTFRGQSRTLAKNNPLSKLERGRLIYHRHRCKASFQNWRVPPTTPREEPDTMRSSGFHGLVSCMNSASLVDFGSNHNRGQRGTLWSCSWISAQPSDTRGQNDRDLSLQATLTTALW